MQFALGVFALLCCHHAGAAVTASADHPMVKVIAMLEDLKAKSIAEGKEEAVAYEKFTYWCSTSIAEVKDAIADEKSTIDELSDAIDGKKKEIESLKEMITTLEEQLGKLDASAKAAKDDRADEAKLYEKTNKDLEATIKAMADAIKALKEAEGKTEPKMLLAQKNIKNVLALISLKASVHELKVLENFAADPKREVKAKGDMEAHKDKYDFKSENVIELLKNLKLKFEDDQLATTKAETNAINAYDLSKAARDGAIEAAKKSKEKKEKQKASTEKALADDEGALKDTKADLEADSKSLSSTEESCSTKKSEWETRSETRVNEIKAMDMAVKILAKTTGVRTEAPGNPVPPPSPVKFLQVSSSRRSVVDPKMKAVALLRAAAKDAHSKALERLAMEVTAHLNGPFDAVNNMIEKMIFRLMDEQKQEDEHKLWCDKEIKKTDTMKEDKEDKIKELKAEIKSETAAVSKLTEDITNANKMISDITAFMKEATEIREVGKKENKLAIKDAQDAQAAVSNAIAVLEAFYKESGAIKKEAWEFVQAPVKLPKNPETWDSGYTGVADPAKQPGGIIAVLKTVAEDFSKMEADTRSQETVDQKEFEESIKANKIEKARRTKESEMKDAEKSRRNEKITSLSSTLKNTESELEKTNQYLKDLQPACVDGDSSYDDRKAARAKEIKALKSAKKTLAEAFSEKAEAKGKFLELRHVKPHM
jgi:DNA repair exonuclease SbcCD ATPase subunit